MRKSAFSGSALNRDYKAESRGPMREAQVVAPPRQSRYYHWSHMLGAEYYHVCNSNCSHGRQTRPPHDPDRRGKEKGIRGALRLAGHHRVASVPPIDSRLSRGARRRIPARVTTAYGIVRMAALHGPRNRITI